MLPRALTKMFPYPGDTTTGRPPSRQSTFNEANGTLSQPIEYQAHCEKEDAASQLEWTTIMDDASETKASLYKKVSALVISWDESSDDLKTKSEVPQIFMLKYNALLMGVKVEAFSAVLVEQFNYKVTPAVLKIDHAQLPQVQIGYHVSQFVYQEDGPNTLLIVYYAGHGTPGSRPGNLALSG